MSHSLRHSSQSFSVLFIVCVITTPNVTGKSGGRSGSRTRLRTGSSLDVGSTESHPVTAVLCPRNRLQLNRGDKGTSRDLRRLRSRHGHADHLSPAVVHGNQLHIPHRDVRV